MKMWLFYIAFASVVKTAVLNEALLTKNAFNSYQRAKIPASALSKRSNPGSNYSPSPTASLAYPAPYTGYPTRQTGLYHCVSYPGAPAMNRNETFEIKGKSFKSVGCWRDNPDRAMEILEGKHHLLKDLDYRSRANALMKCAEVAFSKNFVMFALQNGGQCFGGKDAEKTFRKYGSSSACCGDGEGGPWSNEVYSFLRDNGKPIVNASYIPWSPWSPCPQTCHNGNNTAVQIRNRTCSASPGLSQGCPTSIETRPCQIQVCEALVASPCTKLPSTTFPTSKQSSPQSPVCRAKVDLVILIDGSGSSNKAGLENFKWKRNFVKKIVGGFEISSELVHIGVIIFAKFPKVVFGLDEYYLKNSTLAAIDGIKYPGGRVGIGAAMDSAGKSVFGRSARYGFPKMLIVITGGRSQDLVIEPAQKLRDSGVTIFCVGIGGPYNMQQLKEMATEPDSQHVYKVDINNVATVVSSIIDRACLGSGGVIHLHVPQPLSPTVCKAKLDLAILIDGPQSVEYTAKENFLRCLQFIKKLVSGFNIAKEGTHVGIVVYSRDARVLFGFEKYFNLWTMSKAIDSIQYPQPDGTYTGQALDVARKQLFDASARQGVPRILLIITDGASQDDVDEPSKRLRDIGVTVLSLGVGKAYDINQLNIMATDPDFDHVFTADFMQLDWSFTEKIKVMACKGSGGSLEIPGRDDVKSDDVKNLTRLENRVVDNESNIGEISSEGEIKYQWGSGENNETTLGMPVRGEFLRWDRRPKPKEFKGYMDRSGRETRQHFTSRNATLAGFFTLRGKSVAERILPGINRLRDKYGILILPNGKFTILRGNGFQGVGLTMIGNYRIKMRSGNKQIGILRKSSKDKSLETAANAVPRYGTLRKINGLSAYTGGRVKPYSQGITFEGEAESLDGYPINKDINSTGEKAMKSDTNEGRISGMANNPSLGHGTITKKVNTRHHTNGANSQMSEQWVGTLKAKSTPILKEDSLSKTNYSLQEKKITRKPSVKRPFRKGGPKLMNISTFPEPMALYPLTAKYEAKDVTGGNLPGIINNVVPAAGPFNQSGNSLSFLGTPNSYIEFPNNGKLDTNTSLSLLAWILPKQAGPIFNYKTDGWGVNFWMARPRKLFARFVAREKGAGQLPAVKSTQIKPNKWNFVCAIYDQNSGRASLWINGKLKDVKFIGNISLATSYPVRMGARTGDKRNFRGRISCMQVYNEALTPPQISNAKWKCRSFERTFKEDVKLTQPSENVDQLWD